MNKVNRFIYCIVDDLRANHFFGLIEKGLLPNFERLMKSGMYSKNCITDFPTITYPTQVSQITGTYTGDYKKELCHGVPSYNWMGRDLAPPILRNYGSNNLQIYKMNTDIGDNCQTILEMIGEGNKTSLTQYVNRGTDYMIPHSKAELIYFYILLSYGIKMWTKETMVYANTMVVKKLIENFKKPQKFFGNNEAPIGTLLWFMSSDVLQHMSGYNSYIYLLNLIHIDKTMGLLLTELEKMGYLEDTVIVVTTDHGNYKADKVGELSGFLKKNSLTQYNPKKPLKGNMDLAEFGALGEFNFKGTNNTNNAFHLFFLFSLNCSNISIMLSTNNRILKPNVIK